MYKERQDCAECARLAAPFSLTRLCVQPPVALFYRPCGRCPDGKSEGAATCCRWCNALDIRKGPLAVVLSACDMCRATSSNETHTVQRASPMQGVCAKLLIGKSLSDRHCRGRGLPQQCGLDSPFRGSRERRHHKHGDSSMDQAEQLREPAGVGSKSVDLICETCDKGFSSLGYLENLQQCQQRARPARKHRCSYCPYSSKNRLHVTRHKWRHTGDKPFVCQVGQEVYRCREDLEALTRAHSRQGGWRATECGRTLV